MASETDIREAENLPKISPKKQRLLTAQQQAIQAKNQENRRHLLEIMAGAVGLTAAGGITWKFFDQKKPAETHLPPNRSTLETEIYKRRLGTLNAEILKNPQGLAEIAPRVGELAIEVFCKDMGYDPKAYDGRVLYLWNNEYRQSSQEDSGCVNMQNADDEYGNINILSNRLKVNLSKVLYHDLKSTKPQEYPAVALFSVVVHELFHLTAPLLPNPGDPETKLRGVGFLRPNNPMSKPGYTCFNSFRRELEEAVVVDATQRIDARFGITELTADDYKKWTDQYRSGIVERLFSGDHRALLRLHQQSNQDAFFRLIGEKLGSKPEQAIKRGEQYAMELMD